MVISRAENYISPSGAIFSRWLCRCDCGNEKVILGSSLVTGHTKSCGCLSKRYKVNDSDMIGKKFGMLTVVSRAESHKIPSGSVYDKWNCVCDCGNTTVSFGRQLRTGCTQSCGCQRVLHMAEAGNAPNAENWLREYLEQNDVVYEYQKTFPDLTGVNGGLLSYDFYLPSYNVLIELNGLQHYKSVDWFGGEATLIKQQQHDNLKLQYAKKHGYKLIIIPTDHISKNRLLHIIESLNL